MFIPSLQRLVRTCALALVCSMGTLRAQEPVTFTNMQQVLALKRQVSRDSNFTARLSGVVTYTIPGNPRVCIHDGTNAIVVSARGVALRPGMLVEVEGLVAPGDLVPKIERATVTIQGEGKLPNPIPANYNQLRSGIHFGRYISTRGLVQDMTLSGGTLTLMLSKRENTLQVQSPVPPGFTLPQDWKEALVEVHATCWTSVDVYGQGYDATLYAVNTNAIRVIKPGRTNIFDIPLLTGKEARLAATNGYNRVRLQGTVTQFSPLLRSFYIEMDNTPVICEPLRPLRRSSSQSDALPVSSVNLRPGDRAEVVGVPFYTGQFIRLQLSEWRRVGEGPAPEPISTTSKELLEGKHWLRLVRLKARVLNRTSSRAGPLLMEQVSLESDGLFFTAMGDMAEGELKLDRGGWAEVTGIAHGQLRQWDPPHTVNLRLRNGNDLRLIPPPRWWQRSDSQRIAAAAGGVALLASLLIWLQRRQVLRLRRAHGERQAAEEELRQLNVQLEERVTARTQELADANGKLRHEVLGRELAEADLRIALAAEKELNQLKSLFVSMVSHEFRTPLEVILSSSNILDRYLDRLPIEKRKMQLRAIRKSVHRMNDLIEDVLLLGKLEAGRLQCSSSPLDLESVCRRAVAEIESAAGREGAIRFRAEPMKEASGDESLLHHILTNLLGNALKYSPPHATVDFSVCRRGLDAEIVIGDRGCGIPSADQARLFTQFYRGSNVAQTQGSGLGLVIVKRCVDLHGGTIHCQSQEGVGTTFTVKLPVFDGTRVWRRRTEEGGDSKYAGAAMETV